MISVGLSKIIIDEKSQEQVVVLKEKSGRRSFPIVIGMNEALAIRMKLSNFLPPRPLTHDLMKVLLDSVNVSVEKVCIDKVIEINLNAQFILTRELGRDMLKEGRGKIVFTCSLLTFQGGITVPGYAASKGGVGQLVKAFSNEWASKGINVNGVYV
jgi:hypothetical protein